MKRGFFVEIMVPLDATRHFGGPSRGKQIQCVVLIRKIIYFIILYDFKLILFFFWLHFSLVLMPILSYCV